MFLRSSSSSDKTSSSKTSGGYPLRSSSVFASASFIDRAKVLACPLEENGPISIPLTMMPKSSLCGPKVVTPLSKSVFRAFSRESRNSDWDTGPWTGDPSDGL